MSLLRGYPDGVGLGKFSGFSCIAHQSSSINDFAVMVSTGVRKRHSRRGERSRMTLFYENDMKGAEFMSFSNTNVILGEMDPREALISCHRRNRPPSGASRHRRNGSSRGCYRCQRSVAVLRLTGSPSSSSVPAGAEAGEAGSMEVPRHREMVRITW